MSVLRVTSKIRQSDKSFLFVVSSLTRTTSPTERLGSRFCHFDLFWRFRRYYLFHLIQNWSARYCALLHHLRAYRSCGTKLPGWGARGRVFIVSCIAGVNGCGSWMSEGTAEMGRLLAFPVTPATRVTSSSWVSYGRPQFLVPQYEWLDYSDRWRWDQPSVLRWLHRPWVFSSRFPGAKDIEAYICEGRAGLRSIW